MPVLLRVFACFFLGCQGAGQWAAGRPARPSSRKGPGKRGWMLRPGQCRAEQQGGAGGGQQIISSPASHSWPIFSIHLITGFTPGSHPMRDPWTQR